MSYLNIVKENGFSRLKNYVSDLIRDNPETGPKRVHGLIVCINNTVYNSFSKNQFPVRLTPTQSEIDKRLDICVDIILECKEKGWISIRISNELPNLFKDRMNNKESMSRESTWGTNNERMIITPDEYRKLGR